MGFRVYNFGAGPAMLPTPVLEKIREEFLDYREIGASVIEISHRSQEFTEVVDEADALMKNLLALPDQYKILYVHGGAQMQFAGIPMNLLGLKPARKACYFNTGNFSKISIKEARRYGEIVIAGSSEDTNFDRIPEIDYDKITSDASYVYLTSNNTVFGTRWNQFPETEIPLVLDSTSEILSRKLDYSKFGVVFAGAQKNLGPSGIALVIIREDLLGKAQAETPSLLNYQVYAENHSMKNTPNTFAIYVIKLVLEWLQSEGGIETLEKRNEEKSALLYEVLDQSDFYQPFVQPQDRSTMNVTFNLPNEDLQKKFLDEALKENLYALKGHRAVGGIRASIYNAMPIEGVKVLTDYMRNFEKENG